MRLFKLIIFLAINMALGYSCKKEANNVATVPNASFTIINAVISTNPIIADLTGADSVASYYLTAHQIGFGASYEYSIPSGKTPVVIYQISDTTIPFYKNDINFQFSIIYSLFLSGFDTNHIDTLFTLDNPPYHNATDSAVGIRFINLSPGSNPISVNIEGSPNGSEVGALAYRNITDFKNYQATQNIAQYVFVIRDVATGDSLTSFTYPATPFQNITIAVIGQEGPSAIVPLSTFQINNF